ncbi:hypothetical protein AB1207_02885 [Kineococcus endophyticus]|uniref:Membrane protein (TIGR02234 family) n=1 Tax=Kineococcus endophyticus TaxID=1181883 RepID=A0ABV3P235_9ACTN
MESVGTNGRRGDEEVPAQGPSAVPRRLRVAAWVLALAALVPPLLAAVAAVDVLSGSLDEDYFASYEYDQNGNPVGSASTVGLTDRWQGLDYLVSADRVLLGPVAVLLLLAGLHLAGRGRPAVPLGARLVAVVAAAASAVVGVGVGAVPLVLRERSSGEEDHGFGGLGGPSALVQLVGSAGPVLFLLAACLLAAVLLLLRRARGTVEDWPAPRPAPVPREAGESSPVLPLPDPAPEHEPLDATPVPVPAAPAAPQPPAVPRLSEEDRAWYRRPTS